MPLTPLLVLLGCVDPTQSDTKGSSFDSTPPTGEDAGDGLPVIEITAPADGALVVDELVLAATAEDEGGVVRVEFLVDGEVVAEDTTEAYEATVNAAFWSDGRHTIGARATDTAGQQAESTISVTVDHTAPSPTIDSPADGEEVSGTISIAVSVVESGGMDSVEFLVDGVSIGTDDSEPYSMLWDTAGASWGLHTLGVTARDRVGLSGSTSVEVNVDNPPLVSFLAPLDGGSVTGLVSVQADAWDDQRVESVLFLVNGVGTAWGGGSPWSWAWDTCGLDYGEYELGAEATDSAGGTSESAIYVFVDQPLEVQVQMMSDTTMDIAPEVLATIADDNALTVVELLMDGVVQPNTAMGPNEWSACDALCGCDAWFFFDLDLSTAADGVHTVSVRVVDDMGETVTASTTLEIDRDADGDGYEAELWGGTDCDDDNAGAHPGGVETCATNYDDDCDGSFDARDAPACLTYYFDGDHDGDGVSGATECWCLGNGSYTSLTTTDCDDTDPETHPGAIEICEDGIDNDCDATTGCLTGDFTVAEAEAMITGLPDDSLGTHVALGDVDGDGVPDLILGVPFQPDAGGVYVIASPATGTTSVADALATLTGANTEDHAGWSLAAADVDADGIGDLVVGAPWEDSAGSKAGCAYVLAGPLSGDESLSVADAQLLGTDAGDEAGEAVAVGDFDGDLVPDFAIGADESDLGGSGAGAVFVVSGPVSGVFDLGGATGRLIGEEDGDATGREIASGDLDGDGIADLVVSADYADSSAGAVYVVLGPMAGEIDLSAADLRLSGESGSDYAGGAIAASDVDGDGRADILVGAEGEDTGGSGAGAGYLMLSPASGSISLALATAKFVGEGSSDDAGSSIGGGDFNADGAGDVFIGAQGADDGHGDVPGAIYVVEGPMSGTIELEDATADILGVSDGDLVGIAAVAGDANGDGVDDILAGAEGEGTGGASAGAAYLLLGGDGL